MSVCLRRSSSDCRNSSRPRRPWPGRSSGVLKQGGRLRSKEGARCRKEDAPASGNTPQAVCDAATRSSPSQRVSALPKSESSGKSRSIVSIAAADHEAAVQALRDRAHHGGAHRHVGGHHANERGPTQAGGPATGGGTGDLVSFCVVARRRLSLSPLPPTPTARAP
jgi:hypothetical protein|eukprot:COSAG06_NODE_4688_length_4037_cov_11.124238_2_plen_166_part_00